MELNTIFELKADGVGARNFEGGGGNVGSVDFGGGKLLGEGQGNCAGTGAYVSDSVGASGRELALSLPKGRPLHTIQYRLDGVLSLRPRDQHRRTDDQVHAPEFLVPGNVLRGHAAGALVESRFISRLFILAQFAFWMREQVGTIAVQRKHEEQLGIQARGRDLGGGKASDGRGEGLF